MTGDERGGVPRRRGRSANAAPRSAANGSVTAAIRIASACCWRSNVNSSGTRTLLVVVRAGQFRVFQSQAFCNLLFDSTDVAFGNRVGIIRRPEGVAPLLIGEP